MSTQNRTKYPYIIDPFQHYGKTKHISKQLFAPLSASKECMILQLALSFSKFWHLLTKIVAPYINLNAQLTHY
jgi:hypothetical protein